MARLLIIAHAPLASALQAVARHAFPEKADLVLALDMLADAPTELVERAARGMLAQGAHAQAETLVLTDSFGGTPANVAGRLVDGRKVRCVAGVNVPMLWRALNYAELPLAELTRRAMDGGRQGVMALTFTRPQEQSGSVRHGKNNDHDQ
jgi:PTS system ascorbate-specific IIA component